MSAYIVDKVHIDLLVDTAICGPRGLTIEPGFWDGVRWFDASLVELKQEADEAYREGGYEAYSSFYNKHTHTTQHTDPSIIGAMLWMENVKSVAARYPDDGPDGRPGPCSDDIDAEAFKYTFRTHGYRFTVEEALGAIRCLDYQSCEHDGWLESEAHYFLQAFQDALCGKIAEGWSWDESDLAKAKATR